VARESLDRDLQPMFNPRGLISFEGKLKVDIRVLTLPEGQDPDDVIRGEPAKWTELIERAKSVVEYVIDTLSAGRNLNDPKEKAALSREVVPFIRDVADPVERAAYAQRLARLLKVDERSVAEQLGAATTPGKKRTRAETQPPIPSPVRAAADRERYCLVELLRAPYALRQLDDTLTGADLPPFDVEDFEDVTHRQVFLALQTMLAEGGTASLSAGDGLEDLLEQIDPALRADVSLWLEAQIARPALDQGMDETRGIVDAALLLRERNLKAYDAQLTNLIREASEENDADSLRELSQAKLSVSVQLKRISRIRYAPERVRQTHAAGH
jgi:DNA primase